MSINVLDAPLEIEANSINGLTLDQLLSLGVNSRSRRYDGAPIFEFNLSLASFTALMAVRAGALFDGAPMVQGDYDGSGTGDVLSCSRGSQISDHWYNHFNGYQWDFGCFWTPEISTGDTVGMAYLFYASAAHYAAYDYDNDRFEVCVGGQTVTDAHTLTAGTTVDVIMGGSTIRSYDGTNYARISANDVQTFGASTQPTASAPDATLYLGSNNGANIANGEIEGAFVVCLPLFDGTYGVDMGFGDVIALHYNSGSYTDIAEIIGANWMTLSWPTDATPGSRTGAVTEDAWSTPHSSNLLTDGFCQTTYGSSAWNDEGTPSSGPSDITGTERIFNWGYMWTNDAANEGIYQDYTCSAGDDFYIRVLAHSDGTSVPQAILYDQDNTAEIGSLTGSTGSDKDAPDVFIFTGEAPAGCTTLRVKVVNTASSGVAYFHQAELYPDLWDDPSMEAGTAPTDVGTPTTSAQSAEQAHSGSNSWKIISDAADEGISRAMTVVDGTYYHVSAWIYALTAGTVDMSVTGGEFQTGNTSVLTTAGNDAWVKLSGVVRATSTTLTLRLLSNGSQTFYSDDVATVALDPVTLTYTPASEANSLEGTGIRVDGRDTLTQPITNVSATSGTVLIKLTFRHGDGDFEKFGQENPFWIFINEDGGNNDIKINANSDTTVRILTTMDGVEEEETWTPSGAIIARTDYLFEIAWVNNVITLSIDGSIVQTVTHPTKPAFSASPDIIYVGNFSNGNLPGDLVASPP